jgi:D-hydroxyproline dehydrogenase subunit beta
VSNPGSAARARGAPAADVVVVGGGAMGAATAYHLARGGARVTLVERGGLGREASGANVGLLTLFSAYSLTEPEPGILHGLTRASLETYAGLPDEVGIDIEYERNGGLIVAETEAELAALRPAYDGYRRHGVPVEWLDPAGARACEPAFVSNRLLGAVHCPWNGQVNPLLLTRALARGAARHGATVRTATPVYGLAVTRGRVTGVRTGAGDIPCATVVNAAGAWAPQIGAMAGVRIPVVPGRGQIVLTEPAPRFITKVLSGVEPMARQTRRGNVIIGSTVEAAGFDKRVTLATMHEFAREILPRFPRLRQLRVLRSWAGLRPMTPDDRPILGPAPGVQGLVLAVGLGRRGICYAGGAGRLVAELVLGKPPFLPADSLGLQRFAAAS